ncbi:MAG: prephenate dehydrogenase [Candidatus Velthaea sp.]
MTPQRIGIAGVGLIGGSIGLRAAALGREVVGFDVDGTALAVALARGAVARRASSAAALAAECDVLVLALPVDATCAVLRELTGLAKLPALIVDVASVKAPVAAAAAGLAHFVGTHPMAGRETGGIGAAMPDLFAGATWAHLPHPDRELVAHVRAFITDMDAVPLEVPADVHDAVVALTSHLPQALSVLLGSELAVADAADGRVRELCGPGIISMLRLARSPESVWAPIAAANAGALAERLRSFAGALNSVADGLDKGDVSRLMSYFRDARRIAGALEERTASRRRSSAYR